MSWKPNTIYEVKPGYIGSYKIKIDNTGSGGVYISGENKGTFTLLTFFNFFAFREVKPKVNHLPEWF